jgi:hypothetical protein
LKNGRIDPFILKNQCFMAILHLFHFKSVCFCLPEQFFSYPTAVTITGDWAANLDVCLALMPLSSEGSFTCHTYCDKGSQFIRSHPKDRHPRPTVGFEPGTQGSLDLCASALTTAPRGRLHQNCVVPEPCLTHIINQSIIN